MIIKAANRYVDRMSSLLRPGNARDAGLYRSAKSLRNLWRGDFSRALHHADFQRLRNAVLAESALSFLGFGIPPPAPS